MNSSCPGLTPICYRLYPVLYPYTVSAEMSQYLSSAANFTRAAKVFSNDTSLDDIALAGELALCCLYGSRSGKGLNALRYRHFTEKVTRGTTYVQLHQQPLLPSFTMHAYISKFMSGRGSGTHWTQKNGDGPKRVST